MGEISDIFTLQRETGTEFFVRVAVHQRLLQVKEFAATRGWQDLH